jgi:hypothetical protein
MGTSGTPSLKFTVSIISPDAPPYLSVSNFGAEDLQGNPITHVNVMERLRVVAQVEYCLVAGSTLTVSLKNNPASYTKQQAALLQADGWVQTSQTTTQGPTDFSGTMSFDAVAPVNATTDWRWDMKITGQSPLSNLQPQYSKYEFLLHVNEPQSPWAAFDHDQSALSYVQPGHNLLVTMVGNYVFPGAYTGSLAIEIRMRSGAAIPGGAPQTLPNLNGKGGFSQTFLLTAPANLPIPGAGFTIVAVLHLSYILSASGLSFGQVADTMVWCWG